MNRYFEWVLSGVVGAIIGMIITYSWSFHLFPILNTLKADLFGDTITFKSSKNLPIRIVAKHFEEEMGESMEPNYVVTCTPEAKNIIIANTKYHPQGSNLEMLEHILIRNSTKLKFFKIESPKNPQILICSFRQDCKEMVKNAIPTPKKNKGI